MRRHAAYTITTGDVDAIVDLADSIDSAHRFLQELFQIERRQTAAEYQCILSAFDTNHAHAAAKVWVGVERPGDTLFNLCRRGIA